MAPPLSTSAIRHSSIRFVAGDIGRSSLTSFGFQPRLSPNRAAGMMENDLTPGAHPMLRKEHNDLLTRTGPGTPGGRLFRSYWIPALLAEELPENECPPVRVKLLSERLLAFRDTQGRYGLIDEFCAHRGVSLWFGRNEEDGLRCPYHGWKYDY